MSSALTVTSHENLHQRFEQLVSEWKQQSRYMSNSAQMALLKPYQRIIGMGTPVVALLLSELQREPDHWFWALESITGHNAVRPEHAGQIKMMADDWIQWGREQGLLAA
jgi:hypothetical protein